ncbi:MAG: sterol desaturase family protein [Actinomycetales bacterium]
MRVDLTVVAIPAYLAGMGVEYAWQRRHPAPLGGPRAESCDNSPDVGARYGGRPGDYRLEDTLASLTMGVGSLLVPLVTRRLLAGLAPGAGRWGRIPIAVALTAAAATTVADLLGRRSPDGRLPEAGVLAQRSDARPGSRESSRSGLLADTTTRGRRPQLRRLTGALAASAVLSTAVAASAAWTAGTSADRLFARHSRDLGSGATAWAVALLGWDFLYYWNHRMMHESRWLWALHVVHHSSERYNLSTALRQPVAEGFTLNVPYGVLALAGVRPALIQQARALHLIYQFWIHTEVVGSLGRLETVFNTPSHHRVHHGSNSQYLDRNHGSVLIVWDRLFGTFEPEDERVVYGLTRNIDTFNPIVIATHEWRDIVHDIADASTWRDRWSFLVRGPGWAYARRVDPRNEPADATQARLAPVDESA